MTKPQKVGGASVREQKAADLDEFISQNLPRSVRLMRQKRRD